MQIKLRTYAIAAFIGLLLIGPAAAQSLDWVGVMRQVSETGQVLESSTGSPETYAHCNRWVQRQTLPRVIPRGNILSPGGVSHQWTVTEVWCERKSRYEWRKQNNG